eukprot:scaffold30463_cov149-Isochrysis_galbana.AAC.2
MAHPPPPLPHSRWTQQRSLLNALNPPSPPPPCPGAGWAMGSADGVWHGAWSQPLRQRQSAKLLWPAVRSTHRTPAIPWGAMGPPSRRGAASCLPRSPESVPVTAPHWRNPQRPAVPWSAVAPGVLFEAVFGSVLQEDGNGDWIVSSV